MFEEKNKNNDELNELFGIWSEEEFNEFMECIKDSREIEEEDWKL